jgi:hypothetical protein
MANLNMAKRKQLPSSSFGLPGSGSGSGGKGSGSFPMPDANHARLALSMVGHSVKAGNTSPSQAATVRAKANRMLGKSTGSGVSGAIKSKGLT